MNLISTQQAALDNALVPSEKRLKIERCNARIAFSKPQKEETYQATLDALKLCPCYLAFQITVEVFEIHMHQLWNTIKKIGKTNGYNFKLDKKKCRVDTKVFREILHICPRLPIQDFMELPSEEDLLTFIKELGYSGKCDMLSTIRTDQMHQPWRTFTDVINKINLHTTPDDTLLDIKDSKAYKTYLDYATGKVPPKKTRKFKKPASPKLKIVLASPKEPTRKGKRVKRAAKKATSAPKTDVVIRDTPDAQLKETLRKSKKETHKLQASGLREGADFESKVPDEQADKTKYTSEGTGVKPGIPDVSKEDSSDSDDDSWGNSKDESDDVHDEDDNDDNDGNNDDSGNDDDGRNDTQDSEKTYLDDDENPFFILKDYEEEEQNEEYVHTPEKDKSDDEEMMYEEEDDDVAKELYGDLNIIQELKDIDMTNVEQGGEDQQNASHESGFVQEEEDAHVTLTTVHDKTKGPLQSSSISSDFTSKLLNLDDPSSDINSLINTSTIPPPPPSIYSYSHPTTIPQQQTPDSTTTTTYPIMTLPVIHIFSSLFQLDQRVSTLETKVSKFNQTIRLQLNKLKEEAKAENQEFINQVDSTMKKIIKEQVKAQVSKFMPQIENYITESLGAKVLLDQRVSTLETKVSKFNQTNKLKEEAKAENQEFINQVDSTMKKIIKEQVKAQVSKFMPQIENYITESLGAKVPPQKWISIISKECYKEKKPPRTFDDLMGTLIDFSAYVMNRLKIDNLTQEILVGPAFNLLKGTSKSFAELKYHSEEFYKVVNDRLDWHNPERREYPFDLSKLLPLIEDRGCQVVPADYFINNDLKYLKGGSSSSKYATSTTRTKAANQAKMLNHQKAQSQRNQSHLDLPKALNLSLNRLVDLHKQRNQNFEAADIEMQQDQGNESGHIDDQPANEAAPKHNWFQKL
nr:hypothetical protein [Tanacetum cinerariifolium]